MWEYECLQHVYTVVFNSLRQLQLQQLIAMVKIISNDSDNNEHYSFPHSGSSSS